MSEEELDEDTMRNVFEQDPTDNVRDWFKEG